MEGLIMMLKNMATGKWHPIMYVEKFLPGGPDANPDLVRLKSKGHHTSGFDTREEAVASLDDLKERMLSVYVTRVTLDIETDILWNGLDLPLDTQMRLRTNLK